MYDLALKYNKNYSNNNNNNNNGEIYYSKANALLKLNRNIEAIESYNQAFAENPTGCSVNSQFYENKANALYA